MIRLSPISVSRRKPDWLEALGRALAGLLLAPAVVILCRRMGRINRSMIGTAFSATGLLAAILIGCLAPIHGLDFPIHLVPAYTAFISLRAAISAYLTMAARARNRAGLPRSQLRSGLAGKHDGLRMGPLRDHRYGLCVLTSWCS
jgi:hypothetical protein